MRKTGGFLKNKMAAANGVVQPVGRFYPSSKTCSGCKHLKAELDLSERTYCCERCGLTLDRDFNAAVNILHEVL